MKKILLISVFGLSLIAGSTAVYADHHAAGEAHKVVTEIEVTQIFTKKRYKIKGGWNVSSINGQTVITFDDDFKTKGGPDLKVFLSRKGLDELSGQTVIPTSERLGVLKTNKGAQSYIIPEAIDLTEFKSIVIHCEAFSVLWGGFDLPDAQVNYAPD